MEWRSDNGGCYLSSLNHTVTLENSLPCKVKFITACHTCSNTNNCGILGFRLNLWAQLFVSILLAFVGFFIWRNKKFKKHPYPLIAWTSLIQSFYFNSITINSYQCFPSFFDLNVRSLRILPILWERGI